MEAPMNDRLHDEKATRLRLGGIGRSMFYELVSSGDLRSVKIGKRRLVPEQAICEYIARLERAAGTGTPAA
jgi:excisionase family DNA binding protein